MALLPKDSGGYRAVALLALAIRGWGQMRGVCITYWADSHAGPWDQAARGSSALTAALKRLYYDETAEAAGVDVSSNMWGIEQLYDSLPPALVAERALALGYPPQVVAMSLIAYSSPRFLRQAGHVSADIQPTLSILAGCESGNFARTMIYHTLEHVHNKMPPQGRGREVLGG